MTKQITYAKTVKTNVQRFVTNTCDKRRVNYKLMVYYLTFLIKNTKFAIILIIITKNNHIYL